VAVNFGRQLHLGGTDVIRRGLPILALMIAACGGGGRGQVAPLPAAETGLRSFLQAAKDSNLTAMAAHWGNVHGPAGATGSPADYQKRMLIIQAWLKDNSFRVLSNEPSSTADNQRVLQVELTRGSCVNVVPFTMIRTGGGDWLVYQFNLEQVGSPGRPCVKPDSTH
jgi:hypothetical protein